MRWYARRISDCDASFVKPSVSYNDDGDEEDASFVVFLFFVLVDDDSPVIPAMPREIDRYIYIYRYIYI